MNQWDEDLLDSGQYKTTTGKLDGLELPIRIAIVVIYLSIVARIFLFNFLSLVTGIAILALAVLYFMRYSRLQDRALIHHMKLVLVIVVIFDYLTSTLHLLNFELPYQRLILLGLIVYWSMAGQNDRVTDENGDPVDAPEPPSKFAVLYRVSTIGSRVAIIAGVLFKIQHWPFASLLLGIGFILLSLGIILSYYSDPFRRYF